MRGKVAKRIRRAAAAAQAKNPHAVKSVKNLARGLRTLYTLGLMVNR